MDIKKGLLAGVVSASLVVPIHGFADFNDLGGFSAVAQAQINRQGNLQTQENNSELSKEERRAAVCAKLETNVEARANKFAANLKRHRSAYLNLKVRADRLVAKAEANDYDTTELAAHVQILNDKIDKFVSDYEAYVAALTEVRLQACANAGTELADSLKEARALLRVAKQSGQEAKQYFKDVIKSDIRELHAQAEAEAEAEANT